MISKVTFSTKSDDVKPMLRGVPEMVMPVVCLLAAMLAETCLGTWHTTGRDFIAYCIAGFVLAGVLLGMAFLASFLRGLAFVRPLITCLIGLAFVCFAVGRIAGLAFCAMIIAVSAHAAAVSTLRVSAKFASFVSVKFLKRLYVLACAAAFLYNAVRHDLFLFKRLCLEPVAVRPAFGSLHITGIFFAVNPSLGEKIKCL